MELTGNNRRDDDSDFAGGSAADEKAIRRPPSVILTTLPVRVSAKAASERPIKRPRVIKRTAQWHSLSLYSSFERSQITLYLISRRERGLLWLAGAG